MTVRADLNISLDGYATTTDQTPEDPFGQDWGRIVAAYTSTRTFRERVLHDESGEGTSGVDDRYAQAHFAEIGAEITGAGMFGLHNFPDDPTGVVCGEMSSPSGCRFFYSPTQSDRQSKWQAAPRSKSRTHRPTPHRNHAHLAGPRHFPLGRPPVIRVGLQRQF